MEEIVAAASVALFDSSVLGELTFDILFELLDVGEKDVGPAQPTDEKP